MISVFKLLHKKNKNGNTFIMGVDAHAPEELLDFHSYHTLVQKVEGRGGIIHNRL